MKADLALQAILERRTGERLPEVLVRAADQMIAHTWDLFSGLAALRARPAVSVPTLQARLLQRHLAAQAELARALHRAFPDRLDAIIASALTGAMVGAISHLTPPGFRGVLPSVCITGKIDVSIS